MTENPSKEEPTAVDPVVDQELPLEKVDVKPKKTRVGFFSRLRRESKRDRQIASLSDGYQQMVDLMGSIQLHLESQTQSQKYLLNAMEHLPEVADGIQKMGSAAEKQTEVLGLMREQLDSSVTHDKQLVDSMKRFNKTLAAMNVILFILMVGGICVGVYFAMSANSLSTFVEKAKEVFAKEAAPIETVLVAPAEEPTNEVLLVAGEPLFVESNEVEAAVCPETEAACSNDVAVCVDAEATCSNVTEAVAEELIPVEEAIDAEIVPVVEDVEEVVVEDIVVEEVAEDDATLETVVDDVVVPAVEMIQDEVLPASEEPLAL